MSPAVNGSQPTRPFTNGVYCPLITPFTADEEIDFAALDRQVIRLTKAGMGLVLLGTNGEASHLTDSERASVIASARKALDGANFPDVPLLVGTGGGSAKSTIKLAKEAKEAGADYAITILPGYFSFAMGRDKEAIKEFFVEVLDKSALPVMIYNFPGAASGVDLDSDLLIELSNHPNCFGAKLTCAGIGKGHRLAAHTQSKAYLAKHAPFQVMPGFSDYLVPAMVARHTGCITGTGNIIPKCMVKLYTVALEAIETGSPSKMHEALALQDIIANADWCIVKAGIGGTKYALDKFVGEGMGGYARKPLPQASAAVKKMVDEGMAEAWAFEQTL